MPGKIPRQNSPGKIPPAKMPGKIPRRGIFPPIFGIFVTRIAGIFRRFLSLVDKNPGRANMDNCAKSQN